MRPSRFAATIVSASRGCSSTVRYCWPSLPNEGFWNDSYRANVRYALIHLYNGTLEGGGADEWVEVNGLKWLFRSTQRWSKTEARTFLSSAWVYLGFE